MTDAAATATVIEEATTANEETLVEEEAGYKVFVGNLSFQTNEEELADFFGRAGKVLKANIITRGTRSLGYGFVALETEEEAKKAVDDLNKLELGGRQINVEVAKPKTESTSNHDAQGNISGVRRGRGRFGGYRGRTRGRGRGRGGRNRGRGGWGSRRRFSSRNSHSNNEDSGEAAENNDSTAVTASDAPNADAAGAAKTGEPSKTVVFVANLPFSVNDDGLKEIFKDYNVTSAHVVRRRGGRSKGFGFVELVDEEEQKKALDGLKGVKSEERELVIKVALSDQHVQQTGDEEKTPSGVTEESATTEENKEPVTTV
ncbi:13351_t:CDS:2 [Ambispora gerdemannii]|uniref:13351_t:CDS:1 n=1 Tax=Ambispora gerdemannii TaxID=144530 RepID=A0A9N9G1Q0_9GLOM|nr:13351_t:CDS:2 [Ambispora gerdemannii]